MILVGFLLLQSVIFVEWLIINDKVSQKTFVLIDLYQDLIPIGSQIMQYWSKVNTTCDKRTLYILYISILPILLQSPFYLCCFHLLVKIFFCLPLIVIYSKLFSTMKNSVKYIRKQVSPLVDLVITTKKITYLKYNF